MAKRKPDYHMQAKFWHPQFTQECAGTAPFVIGQCFMLLPHDRREQLIRELTDWHNEHPAEATPDGK
jgi:hypothetical protein